jgi:hypothetical protein
MVHPRRNPLLLISIPTIISQSNKKPNLALKAFISLKSVWKRWFIKVLFPAQAT